MPSNPNIPSISGSQNINNRLVGKDWNFTKHKYKVLQWSKTFMCLVLWHLQFYGRSIGHMDTCEVLSKLIDFILPWCNTRWNFVLHSVSHSAPWSGSFKFFLLCVSVSQRSVFCLCLVVSLILHLYASCFYQIISLCHHFWLNKEKNYTDSWTKTRIGLGLLEFQLKTSLAAVIASAPKNQIESHCWKIPC